MATSEAERKLKRQIRRERRGQESDISRFVSRLNRIFDRSLDEVTAGIDFGEVDAIQAAAQLQRLETVMAELGLQNEFGRIQAIHAEELGMIRDRFQELTGENVLTALDASLAAELITTNIDQVALTAEKFAVDVKSNIISSVLLNQEPDIGAIKDTLAPRALANIQTEINTSLSGFRRGFKVKKALDVFGDGAKFIYIGPEDNKTRDFCQGILDREPPIYSRVEIENLDNGQAPANNVFVFGGGFNCRHDWEPIDDSLERELRS